MPKLSLRQAKIVVLMGDGQGNRRIGGTDLVWVRRYAADGRVDIAHLPRLATSTNPSVLSTAPATLNDSMLPVEGTRLIARPLGSYGPDLGHLLIDVSSLPTSTTA